MFRSESKYMILSVKSICFSVKVSWKFAFIQIPKLPNSTILYVLLFEDEYGSKKLMKDEPGIKISKKGKALVPC